MNVPIAGVAVMARSQLNIMEIATTCKRLRQNSPVLSGDRPMGAKARTAIKVPPSMAQTEPVTVSEAASSVDCPRCTPTSMPSVTTMALSTREPRAMISAARDTC